MSAFKDLPTGCDYEGTVYFLDNMIPTGFPFCEVPPFIEPVFVPRLPEIIIPDIAPPDVCRCIEFNVEHSIQSINIPNPIIDFTIAARVDEETGEVDCCEQIFDINLNIQIPLAAHYTGLWASRCNGSGQICVKYGVYHIPGWGWFGYPGNDEDEEECISCSSEKCVYLKVQVQRDDPWEFVASLKCETPNPDEEDGVFWVRIACNTDCPDSCRQEQYGVVLIPTTIFG